jgi:hypothetical protein
MSPTAPPTAAPVSQRANGTLWVSAAYATKAVTDPLTNTVNSAFTHTGIGAPPFTITRPIAYLPPRRAISAFTTS